MNDEKLQKIETTLAHQDQQIHDLSDMINQQWQMIETLKRQLDIAQGKIRALASGSYESGEDSNLSVSEIAARDKPPHY